MPSDIDPNTNAYVSLWSPGNWFRGATSMASLNVLLTWLKIFRYIGFVPVFAQISRVLEASFRACFGFIVVIVLVGFATASAFLLAFGTRIEGFRNLTEAASSVFMGFLGDISLNELRAANYWLGPVLFIIFLLLGIFVLLNMFIAIIGEAYSSTKEAMHRAREIDLSVSTALHSTPLHSTPLHSSPLLHSTHLSYIRTLSTRKRRSKRKRVMYIVHRASTQHAVLTTRRGQVLVTARRREAARNSRRVKIRVEGGRAA